MDRPLIDSEPEVGTFVKVIAGKHEGRYGVLHAISLETDDGWPLTTTVRTRDDRDELIPVKYKHLRPDTAGKR